MIVIKNTDAVIDFVPAMEQILEDITTKGRAQKSVVIYTGGWTVSWIDDYEDLKDDIYHQRSYGDIVRQLLAEGVPVVCASGNDGALKGRENIDTLPALFQDDGTPLINVGAADYAGQRWFASQGGSQLTIYAPGVDITIPQNVDRQSRTDSGTSLGQWHCGIQSHKLLTKPLQPQPKSVASSQHISHTPKSHGTTPRRASNASKPSATTSSVRPPAGNANQVSA